VAIRVLRRVDMELAFAFIELDAMPRTGDILRRIHVFVELQGEYDEITRRFDFAWLVIRSFSEGLTSEEGITIKGWDMVEELFEFLYEYSAWEDFRLAEENAG